MRSPGRQRLVFISHDHREQLAAQLVADAIRDVSSGVLPTFYSSAEEGESGIEYGEEWFQKIQQKLSSTTYIICILTPQSMPRPWIYFEAGFARGKNMETPIVALLLGLDSQTAKSGPFAHFKFVEANESAIAILLRQIADRSKLSPTDNTVEAAAENLIKRLKAFSIQKKGSRSSEAVRAYRACVMHAKSTFGLMQYLYEHERSDDAEIARWMKERNRRRVFVSLLKVDVISYVGNQAKLKDLGLRIYDNLVHADKDPDPVAGEMEVYRRLLNEMNFVPKILNRLFTEPQHKISHSALMKLVSRDWEPSDLPRSQAEVAFTKVLEMLREARVVQSRDGQTVQLTQRGQAMCSDLFSL